MKDINVLVATPNYTNTFPAEADRDRIEAAVAWTKAGINFAFVVAGRTFVHFARSKMCEIAIDGKFSHIFWVDDDAIFKPDILPRFIDHDKDVVISPYPMRRSGFEIGVLSATTFYCKDCKKTTRYDGTDAPILEKNAECGACGSKNLWRNFHAMGTYRNLRLADMDQGLIDVDGGGTHVMLVKTKTLLEARGEKPPALGEPIPDMMYSYPREVIETMSAINKLEPGQKKIINNYLGDIPDQSMTLEEEAKEDKPFFMMPKSGTEDMMWCAPEGVVYGDFQDVSIPSAEVVTHTGRKERVTQFHSRHYQGDLIRIKAVGAETVRLTPNHCVFTSVTQKRWTEAGNIKTGDKLFTPRPRLNNYKHTLDMTPYAAGALVTDSGIQFQRTWNKASTVPSSITMSPDLAWLFGFYVAEGHADKNLVSFSYNADTEKHYCDRVMSICKDKLGLNEFDVRRKVNSGQVRFTNTVLARFFRESFGPGATTKRFPKWISDNLMYSGQVLRGLWDGDGMMGHNVLTTTSRILAHQVKMLLAAHGIFASVRTQEKNLPRHTIYTVRPFAEDRKKFGLLLGVPLPDKMTNSKSMVEYVSRANGMEGWWVPVESVSTEQFEGTVYNAGVPNAHSYVMNGVAVHNCYRAKCKGVGIYCDTDVFSDHVGFAPIITKEWTRQMEQLEKASKEEQERQVLLVPGSDVERDHKEMKLGRAASLV